jgi:hypothetical protein
MAMAELKRCCTCKELKLLDKYYKYQKSIDGHFASCISCEKKRTQGVYNKCKAVNTDAELMAKKNGLITKTCYKCNETKPILEFNVRRLNSDGFMNLCKDCRKLEKNSSYHKKVNSLSLEELGIWRIQRNNKSREESQRLKMDVFSHYCKNGVVCCLNPYHIHPEIISDLDLLTLDHINSDGCKEEVRYGKRLGGRVFYRQLRKEGYPIGLQVLCWNCQARKVTISHEHSSGYNGM